MIHDDIESFASSSNLVDGTRHVSITGHHVLDLTPGIYADIRVVSMTMHEFNTRACVIWLELRVVIIRLPSSEGECLQRCTNLGAFSEKHP